jgi:hypothetical protein
MAWVAGPDGAWEIPVAATPLAAMSAVEQDAATPREPAALSPVLGSDLLAALTSLADDELLMQRLSTHPRQDRRALV